MSKGWIWLVLCLLPFGQAQAFSKTAHEAICERAFQQLEPAARSKVKALVRQSPKRLFAQLCAWPDQVRDQKAYKHTKRWHYVNVPRKATSVELKHCHRRGCILSALTEMTHQLTTEPDWQALAFVGHLVADLHQPVHVSYADDRGGNRAPVIVDGEKSNLHVLWDRYVPGLTGNLRRDRQLLDQAADSVTSTTALDASGQSDDFLIWANESLEKTRSIYQSYRANTSKRIDEADLLDDQRWLRQRMALASDRLAALLNRAFAEMPES